MSFSIPFSSSQSSQNLAHCAYLLVIHGSRDPRPAELAAILAQQVNLALGATCFVEFASLECSPTPLHEQIVACANRALNQGCQSLKIMPLFLSPGVHVRDDIPEEVALAKQMLEAQRLVWPQSSDNRLSIDSLPYLGSASGLITLLEQQIKRELLQQDWDTDRPAVSSPYVILLAHGSRRAGGNQPIEAIAAHLGAVPAYWSVEPKLSEQVRMIAAKDHRPIVIIPYFLFAGSITDAIAQCIDQFKIEGLLNPILLGSPLVANPELASLLVNQLTQVTTLS